MTPSAGTLRTLWLQAGGAFHGPKVEHGTITEEKLFVLLRDLVAKTESLEEIRTKTYGFGDGRHALWHIANDALKGVA